jgi:hypothetical protein
MDDDRLKTLGVILVLVLLGFCVTDCVSGKNRYCPGLVREHIYHPPYTSTHCSSSKSGTHCHTTYHPAEYRLLVECQKPPHVANINVGSTLYTLIRNEETVTVGERCGRWTGIIWSDWIQERNTRNDY